jgi:hypothetical protein
VAPASPIWLEPRCSAVQSVGMTTGCSTRYA